MVHKNRPPVPVMIRRFFHGSNRILRSPRFGAGHPYNDFGLGFYCTENKELASEWAAGFRSNGFTNSYSLNDTGLRIIDLTSPQYSVLHWLSVLSNYREFDTASSYYYQCKEYIRNTFQVDAQNCDCMIGLRADNTNFAIAQDFMNGEITYGQLCRALSACSTGRQFVLKSNRAFDRIVFEGYEPALSTEHYPVRSRREIEALHTYSGICSRTGTDKSSKGELYITHIFEQNMQPFDPLLRQQS